MAEHRPQQSQIAAKPPRTVAGTAQAIKRGDRLVLVNNAAALATLQLPDPSLSSGFDCEMQMLGSTFSFAVTLLRFGSETINGAGADFSVLAGAYQSVRVRLNGANWIVSGNGLITND